MAIFNTARLVNVLVRGQIADPEPASELVDELEAQMSTALSDYPSRDGIAATEARLMQVLAEIRQSQAEMEARLSRHINQATGVLLAGIALAVGLILGFG